MQRSFHQDYLTLVADIEQRFPVADWTGGDVEIWPLARMDLYLDLYWQQAGVRPTRSPWPMRALGQATRPLSTLWKHRAHPQRAEAIFLGDGVSLDRVDGAWEDRYGEPLIAALEAGGANSFLMQSGDVTRSPWRRPIFAAHTIEAAGHALAPFLSRSATLPDHPALMEFLRQQGVEAPSLTPGRLARRARTVAATALAFERILAAVRPRLAFTVTWYAGLGPAFLLACRRQGIMSIDLQHCPQGGRHKAYRWDALPRRGYGVLPAVFWNWSEAEATDIASWAVAPWHRSIHGGHPRLTPFLDDADPRTRHWDAQYRQAAGCEPFQREILVALQTVDGHDDTWYRLAERIAAAPPGWRWWIRRHPAARPEDDRRYAGLLALRGPNIRVDEASSLPLPALLRHMNAVVSIASGVAAEAMAFGIPAIFLSGDATGPFGYLLESGQAQLAEGGDEIERAIANLAIPVRPSLGRPPALSATLEQLFALADDYTQLCAGA